MAEHRFIVLEELPALGTFDIPAAATGAAALGSTAAVLIRQPPLFLLHKHASTVARIPFLSELLVEDPIKAVAVELLAAMV